MIAENLSPATSYRSAIELLSNDCRSSIFGYEFEQNEFVICCETVSLLSPSADGTYKDFIGVGTCINRGEDVAVKVGVPRSARSVQVLRTTMRHVN